MRKQLCADNLRPSGFFPTPWLVTSNVVSQFSTGQLLDTGAVRTDNTGATPLTISSFQVALGGGPLFNFWGSLTINPGQTGIFTQTTAYNFDASDYGLFGGDRSTSTRRTRSAGARTRRVRARSPRVSPASR